MHTNSYDIIIYLVTIYLHVWVIYIEPAIKSMPAKVVVTPA